MDTKMDTVCAGLSDDEILFTYGDAQSIRGLLESCNNARNAALEEAAEECEEVIWDSRDPDGSVARDIADAIRRLKRE